MKLGLRNITLLLEALGRPERNYFKVQVAGTNGKGSICAFLDSIAQAAGVSVGVYTSPHLVSIRERIRIQGLEIPESDFANETTKVRNMAERLISEKEIAGRPTFFEHLTAMALSYFARSGVRLAVLETGLGGRFDAVTAASSEIKVISRIDLDHQEYLGETISRIAAEKAAIISPGNTVIVGEQHPEALDVIKEKCAETGIEPVFASEVSIRRSNGNLCFDVSDATICVKKLGLKGDHQIENAKIAILAALALSEKFPIGTDEIAAGLENAVHPGRLEKIGRYLLDGAHNPSGAQSLKNYLLAESMRPSATIFGAVAQKDIRGMLSQIAPLTGTLILTGFPNSRAFAPSVLAHLVAAEFPEILIEIAHSPGEALAMVESIMPDKSLVVVTGSLYLVGEIRRLLL